MIPGPPLALHPTCTTTLARLHRAYSSLNFDDENLPSDKKKIIYEARVRYFVSINYSEREVVLTNEHDADIHQACLHHVTGFSISARGSEVTFL